MIRIITDSLCDFTMDYAKENNFDPESVKFILYANQPAKGKLVSR